MPLVRHHVVITVPYVTNVGVYDNGRVLVCGRTHRVLPIVLLADSGGGLYRLKDGVTIDRDDLCFVFKQKNPVWAG